VLDDTVAGLRDRGVDRVEVGLILGSGLAGACPILRGRVDVPYGELHGGRAPAVAGHPASVVWGLTSGRKVMAFLGRVHLYEGATFDEVTFSVRLLASLGARVVVVTQAAGAASPWLCVPGVMVVRDQVNFSGRSFPVPPPEGSLYSPRLRLLVRKVASERGLALMEGVLAGFLGPAYETPAEVRLARGAGAHSLTMSTVPEVVAARSLGLEVVGLSVLTNRAPHSGGRIHHDAVVRNAAAGAGTLRSVFEGFCADLE